MAHDSPAAGTNAGGNVRVYERPDRPNPLVPLVLIGLTALVLLVVLVLLWRQF